MKYHKIIPLFLAAVFTLSGCSPISNSKDNTDKITPDVSDYAEDISGSEMSDTALSDNNTAETPVTGDDYIPQHVQDLAITYESYSDDRLTDDGEITLMYASYQEPTVHLTNEVTAQNILAEFDQRKADYESDCTLNLEAARAELEELGEDFSSYYVSLDYSNERIDEQVISVLSNYYCYTGGAHGTMNHTALNFDAATGQRLGLADITTDKDAMLASIRSYILEQLKLPRFSESLYVSPEDTIETIDEYILSDDCWYFTNSGITFTANQDIIVPYAAGEFYFTVPYEKLEGLKEKYLYRGTYQLAVPIGGTASVDLNGDGTEDSITYSNCTNEDNTEYIVSLSINGIDFTSFLTENEIYLSEGAVDFVADDYYIVDLDSDDQMMELALLDHGPSDDPVTYFFRFDGNSLTFLGSIEDLIGNPTCKLNGDGTLCARFLLNLLETKNALADYQVTSSGILEELPKTWYYVDNTSVFTEYQTHNILSTFTVHTEKSLESDTVSLTAADGPVCFPATDNMNWFVVETADGRIYYLYLEDFMTLEDGQISTDVFENLLMVG